MPIETDALIIGAGPCGLFQVFELGLLGIKAEIVDSMAVPGGQCAELYPDKPIYDIPGIPVCSAEELVANLLKQIEPFDAKFHLGQEVQELEQLDGGRFRAVTSTGTEFLAQSVFIAGGVGSFQPRRLRFPEADALEDQNLFYKVKDPDRFAGRKLVILGGGDSALDWALALWEQSDSLALVHRRDEYRAVQSSVDALKDLEREGRVEIYETSTACGLQVDNGRLIAVDIKTGPEKKIKTLAADDLLVFFGLSPKLGPIAEWGLEIKRKTIPVDTEKFETSIPGIYAVGDINTYPGKKKLILSGFHEAALAAFAAKARLEPGKKVHLQYTTTSPVMHERLGVADG